MLYILTSKGKFYLDYKDGYINFNIDNFRNTLLQLVAFSEPKQIKWSE